VEVEKLVDPNAVATSKFDEPEIPFPKGDIKSFSESLLRKAFSVGCCCCDWRKN